MLKLEIYRIPPKPGGGGDDRRRKKKIWGWSLMSYSICVQLYRLLMPRGGQHGRFQQIMSIYSGFPKMTFLHFIIPKMIYKSMWFWKTLWPWIPENAPQNHDSENFLLSNFHLWVGEISMQLQLPIYQQICEISTWLKQITCSAWVSLFDVWATFIKSRVGEYYFSSCYKFCFWVSQTDV